MVASFLCTVRDKAGKPNVIAIPEGKRHVKGWKILASNMRKMGERLWNRAIVVGKEERERVREVQVRNEELCVVEKKTSASHW